MERTEPDDTQKDEQEGFAHGREDHDPQLTLALHRTQLVIILGKSDKFDELMAAKDEEMTK